MEKYLSKIFTRNTYLALLIGLSFLGIFKYVEYRLNFISEQINGMSSEMIINENKINQKNKKNVIMIKVRKQNKIQDPYSKTK